MFERFGEFDSAAEINVKAAELLEAADTEAVRELARENGLDPEDAEDYITGAAGELATPLMAAAGKLKIESEDLHLGGYLRDWAGLAIDICTENAQVCAGVRKKGRSLKGCMAAIIQYSFGNKVRVDDRIVDAVKVNDNGRQVPMRKPLYLGGEDRASVRQIISGYYMK